MNFVQNSKMVFVPAIPMPIVGYKNKCTECGNTYWTFQGYRNHYAYSHILEMEEI